MANTKSAAKSARQGVKRNARNTSILTSLKTGQKKFRALVSDGKIDEAKSELSGVVSKLDKAVKRGVLHKNTADRHKSTFAKAVAPAKAS